MKHGIPNQKHRAKKIIDNIVRDFSGSDPKSILVVTYLLDRPSTFNRIRKALEDLGIQYDYTGDYNLNATSGLGNWITAVDVSADIKYRGAFSDAYLFCERFHLEEEVERMVNHCDNVQNIFDKEI